MDIEKNPIDEAIERLSREIGIISGMRGEYEGVRRALAGLPGEDFSGLDQINVSGAGISVFLYGLNDVEDVIKIARVLAPIGWRTIARHVYPESRNVDFNFKKEGLNWRIHIYAYQREDGVCQQRIIGMKSVPVYEFACDGTSEDIPEQDQAA